MAGHEFYSDEQWKSTVHDTFKFRLQQQNTGRIKAAHHSVDAHFADDVNDALLSGRQLVVQLWTATYKQHSTGPDLGMGHRGHGLGASTNWGPPPTSKKKFLWLDKLTY